jgi:hypothetical protein
MRGGDNGSPKQDKIERRWTVSCVPSVRERKTDNSGEKRQVKGISKHMKRLHHLVTGRTDRVPAKVIAPDRIPSGVSCVGPVARVADISG